MRTPILFKDNARIYMKHLTVFVLILTCSMVFCLKKTSVNIDNRELSYNIDSVKMLVLPFLTNDDYLEYNNKVDSVFFKEFTYYGFYNIQKLGNTNIYKGFADDGSNAGASYYYFLLSEKGEKGVIVVDDSIFFIKKKVDDMSFYIGSIANQRNGMIEIYDYFDNKYQKVFSSLDDSDYEFSTYTQKRELRSLHSGIDYTVWADNGGLTFDNIDINSTLTDLKNTDIQLIISEKMINLASEPGNGH